MTQKNSVNRYRVGDVVWCIDESRKVGITSKLERIYEGPFLVTKRFSELYFLIQLDKKGTEKGVNHDKLNPYEGDHPPAWLKKARKKALNKSQ